MTSFNNDLFISYAHLDNEPLTSEQEGWITRFHQTLEAILNTRIGGKSRIWRDAKLTGNDVFADEIVDQFKKTALIVSVLTPRYLTSEWCTREVAEFCESAKGSGGMVVENKARIFKILKTPVKTQESLPEVVKDVLGYEFFIYEDDAPLELDPEYGVKYGQDYNRKIGKLAWDIAQLLEELEDETNGTGDSLPENAAAKPTVYMAKCSYDRRQSREILVGELKRLGYTVLPDRELPGREEEFETEVGRMLKSCRLSIHLIGDTYGGMPDGPSQKSESVLQNEIAAKYSKSSGLKRVIWVPEETHSDQPQQQSFIEALHHDPKAQAGADLLTGDLEALKNSIHSTLEKMERPEQKLPAGQEAADDESKLIYLICNEKDRKATIPLRKFCREQGMEVAIPAFEGDAGAARAAHQQFLANNDAVILFYGVGDEGWKRTIDNELKKMAGYRAGKPLPVCYTYLADPGTTDKEELIEMEVPNLIKGFGEFSADGMAEFLRAVNEGGGTQ